MLNWMLLKSVKNTHGGVLTLLHGGFSIISIMELPASFVYWSENTRYVPISDVVSIYRYKKLRQFIHGADNLQKDNLEHKNNGLYEITVAITYVHENCNSLEPEYDKSIDD